MILPLQTLTTRTSRVKAVRFDGYNLADLEVAVKDYCDLDDVFFAPVMEVGCWVLLTPPIGQRYGSYQVLPNSVVQRVYAVNEVAPAPREASFHVLNERSCFSCKHYRESYCLEFDEDIDSELFAAADCEAFAPETF